MYSEIIDDIKKNLSGNKDLDYNYLLSQIEVYKDNEYSKEIIKEISRLMWDCMPEEEKLEYIEIAQKENPVLDIFEEIQEYLNEDDLKSALDKLDLFMKNHPMMFEDDKVSEYHSFTNPLEEMLFEEYVGCEKELRYIPDDYPYLDLYYIYGFLLFDERRLEEAEKCLKKALKINPVSSIVLLELSEIYKATNKNKFFIYTTEALRYAYSTQLIARAYRNLGYHYIEENQLDIAFALYTYSLNFEASIVAFSEMEYIKSKGYTNILSNNEAKELIKRKHIQIGVNPKILEIIDELIESFDKNSFLNQELYFLNMKYELTNDDETFEKIKTIERKL